MTDLTTLARIHVLEAHAQALESGAHAATGAVKAELLIDAIAARGRIIELAKGVTDAQTMPPLRRS